MGDYGRFSRHDLGHFPREGRCHLYAILLRWDSAIYFHYDVVRLPQQNWYWKLTHEGFWKFGSATKGIFYTNASTPHPSG